MRTMSRLFLAAGMAALLGCSGAGGGHPVGHAVVAAPEPASTATAEELVGFEGDLSNRFLRAEQPGDLVVRLRLGAHEVRDAKRPPINLGLVIDTSGSMEGDALRDARTAALHLLDALA